MKITLAEFERTDGAPPLEMFMQGIKAEETREKYSRTLRKVLCGVFEYWKGRSRSAPRSWSSAGARTPNGCAISC